MNVLNFYALCAQVIPVFLLLVGLESRRLTTGFGKRLNGVMFVLGLSTMMLGLAGEGTCLLGVANVGAMTDEVSQVLVIVAVCGLLLTTLIMLTNSFYEAFNVNRNRPKG